jgi:hypothetical protein
MGEEKMIRHRGRVQQLIASRFITLKAESSFCHSVVWCIWMTLTTVVQKIFLSEISTSACTIASSNIAWEGAFIMLVTHMLGVGRLGGEGFILSMCLAREFLKCLVAVLRTIRMRACWEGVLQARGSANPIMYLKMVVVAGVLLQVISASESIGASVEFAVLARILGLIVTE